MDSPELRRLMREIQHPSEECLLGYVDGELKPRAAAKVRRHLVSCWACRAKLGEIERTTAAMVEFRDGLLNKEQNLAPADWRAFPARLARLAATKAELRQPRRGMWISWAYRLAGVAVFAALAAWLWLREVPSVSAREILERAAAAETGAMQKPGGALVRQKLRVVRSSTGSAASQPVELEVWIDPATNRFVCHAHPHLWRELTEACEASGMGGRRPFSVAGYLAWRAALSKAEDQVRRLRLDGGADAYWLSTRDLAPGSSQRIVAAGLLLRRSDWRPIEYRLRVREAGGESEYRAFERGLEAVASGSLPAGVPPAAHPARRMPPVRAPERPAAPPPPPVSPGRAEVAALDADEVAARYALHQVHACLGEQIEVDGRAGGRVVVRGVVDAAARRAEIAAALASLPMVEVTIQTAEEMLEESRQGASAAEALGPPVRTAVLPIEPALKRLFADSGSSREVSLKIADLANRAVTASGSALAHAWAFHRLNRAFPLSRVERLGAPSIWLLERMMGDHLKDAQQASTALRALIEPLRPAGLPPAAAQTLPPSVPLSHSERLLEQAKGMDRLVRYLLAGSPEPGLEPQAALTQLGSAVRRLESELARMETEIAGEWAKLTRRMSERKP